MNGNDIFNRPHRKLRSGSMGMTHPSQVDNVRSHIHGAIPEHNGNNNHSTSPPSSSSSSSSTNNNGSQPQYLNNQAIQQYLLVFADKKRNDALLYTTLIGINFIKLKLNGQIQHASIPQLQSLLASIEDDNARPGSGVNQRRRTELHQNHQQQQQQDSHMQRRKSENDLSNEYHDEDDDYSDHDDGYHIKRSAELQTRRRRGSSMNGNSNGANSGGSNNEDIYLQRIRLLEESLQKQQLLHQQQQQQQQQQMQQQMQQQIQLIQSQHQQQQQQQQQQQNMFPPQSPMSYYQGSFFPQSPAPSTPMGHNANHQFYGQNAGGMHGAYNHQQPFSNFYPPYQNHAMQPQQPQYPTQFPMNPQQPQPHMNEQQYNNSNNNPFSSNGQNPQTPVTHIESSNIQQQQQQEITIQTPQRKQRSPIKETRAEDDEGDKSKGGMAWSLGGGDPPKPKKKPEPKKTPSKGKKTKEKEQPKAPVVPVKREKYVPPKSFGLPYNPKSTVSRIKAHIMQSKMENEGHEVVSKKDDVQVLFKPPPGTSADDENYVVAKPKKSDPTPARHSSTKEVEQTPAERKVSFAERSQHINLESTQDSTMTPEVDIQKSVRAPPRKSTPSAPKIDVNSKVLVDNSNSRMTDRNQSQQQVEIPIEVEDRRRQVHPVVISNFIPQTNPEERRVVATPTHSQVTNIRNPLLDIYSQLQKDVANRSRAKVSSENKLSTQTQPPMSQQPLSQPNVSRSAFQPSNPPQHNRTPIPEKSNAMKIPAQQVQPPPRQALVERQRNIEIEKRAPQPPSNIRASEMVQRSDVKSSYGTPIHPRQPPLVVQPTATSTAMNRSPISVPAQVPQGTMGIARQFLNNRFMQDFL